MNIKQGDTSTVVKPGDTFTMIIDGVLYRGVFDKGIVATTRPIRLRSNRKAA